MVNRREFLASLSVLTAGLIASKMSSAESDSLGELLPTRPLGKNGERITMLGVGGAHIASVLSERDAERAIELAIEGGIRYFDNAASYGNGEGERRYGKYITPKYRDRVFLMSKAHLFDAATVKQQLDNTLLNMNTDYLDLWLMHQVFDPADADARIAGSVLDAFAEAKESGKVRHIGFSGHNTLEQLQEKIDLARSFAQIGEEGRLDLINRVANLTPNGGVEFYKAKGLWTGVEWTAHG